MKIKYLNGQSANWVITGEVVKGKDTRTRSKLHLKARAILQDLFPTHRILEEVTIPLSHSISRYLDFYIPNNKLAIEVHGQQHYKFNSQFHSSARDFIEQRKKDSEKQEWCELNGITYIELPYNEGPEQWTQRITRR